MTDKRKPNEVVAEIAALKAERDEVQLVLDLQADATRRATKRWHEAGGKKNVLPDMADLILWLLHECDRERARADRAVEALRRWDAWHENLASDALDVPPPLIETRTALDKLKEE